MSNVIPFKKGPVPVLVCNNVKVGKPFSGEPIIAAENKTRAILQLKKAIEDIESGHVCPDSVLILLNEESDDKSRLLYYTSGLNHLERLGLVQSAAIAFNFEDNDSVTGR